MTFSLAENRKSLRIGDVVAYNRGVHNTFAKIVVMFTHKLGNAAHLFFRLQALDACEGYGGEDHLLFQRYYRKSDRVFTAGLPIIGNAPWMFEVESTAHGPRRAASNLLLSCDWDLTMM